MGTWQVPELFQGPFRARNEAEEAGVDGGWLTVDFSD